MMPQKAVQRYVKEAGNLSDEKNVWEVLILLPFGDGLWTYPYGVCQVDLFQTKSQPQLLDFVPHLHF